MNKRVVTAIAAALPLAISAQTAIDIYQMSRYDLRGTARFMSMGGAFGALGGDLSTLNYNPAGIGVYRKNEVGATLDIDIQSSKSATATDIRKNNQTKAFCNNFGYVGTVYTDNDIMPFFQWGASFSRVASFDRRYKGAMGALNGSLSNYIAGYTNYDGFTTGELTGTDNNYFAYNAPWLSMLAYNSFVINPVTGSQYNGLWQDGTSGISEFETEEKGFIDEYAINFGGNIQDVVYWGIGFGITDIEYKQYSYYSEDLQNARIPAQNNQGEVDGLTTGAGGFGLYNAKHITGSGFNVKAGVILRPINEVRIGLAVHTPTYYNLTQTALAEIDYGYGYTSGDAAADITGSPEDYGQWKFRTPWRLMTSIAGVIGSQGIISLDYEYRPYQSMRAQNDNGDEYTDITSDIKTYYKAANIVRLGAEYRLTPQFSLRAGYAHESTPTKSEFQNSKELVYTSNPYDSGTNPAYTVDKSTQYITCGLGYRYQNFYADAAYVHRKQQSTYHPFTANEYTATPYSASLDQKSNNIVVSIGVKF